MELHKLTTDDIRGFDAAKLRETEKDVRREMANLRMDIYTAKSQHTGKIRGLKKALARLLTVSGSSSPSAPKAQKAKTTPAPKAVAKTKKSSAAKPPKAAKAKSKAKAK